MFQPSIEFVPLDPEFPMLTTRPPCSSLQLSEMLIFFLMLSQFHWNIILIKFKNKVRRRREKHSTMSHVSPLLLSHSSCFLHALQQNRTISQGFLIFVKSNSVDNFTFMWIVDSEDHQVMFFSCRLCVFRLLLREQMGWPHLRLRKFWLKIRTHYSSKFTIKWWVQSELNCYMKFLYLFIIFNFCTR